MRVIKKIKTETLKLLGFEINYHPKYVHKKLSLHAVDHVLISVIMDGNRRHYLGQHHYDETGMTASIIHYGQQRHGHDNRDNIADNDIKPRRPFVI